MKDSEFLDNCSWRFAAYKEMVRSINPLFSFFLGDYCCNCQQVIGRLPEAEDESFELVEGVYPGCCHRGAGDIFRLEGQAPERSQLAPEIISSLQQERRLALQMPEIDSRGGSYKLRRRRDDFLITGAHCKYFAATGCTLGVLKGPLCINFICPPMRQDLIYVCAGSDELVGPEQDFLFIYRSLAIISYDIQEEVDKELVAVRCRVRELEDRCRLFLSGRPSGSLYDFFNGDN
ncbi:MAG: hypothetical protein KAG92_01335 [Deltaproteobacteria bacterium]|nr:hypothetical protein [Deltaproteobacteria bacterium]